VKEPAAASAEEAPPAVAGAEDVPEEPRRPAFAAKFPREPALDALVAAFEGGDYARVRSEAPKVVASAKSDEIRRAARTLVKRTTPDPLALKMLGLTAALLVVLAGYFWTHDQPPPAPPPTVERVK
jgi:hypothetical protein